MVVSHVPNCPWLCTYPSFHLLFSMHYLEYFPLLSHPLRWDGYPCDSQLHPFHFCPRGAWPITNWIVQGWSIGEWKRSKKSDDIPTPNQRSNRQCRSSWLKLLAQAMVHNYFVDSKKTNSDANPTQIVTPQNNYAPIGYPLHRKQWHTDSDVQYQTFRRINGTRQI